MTTPYSSQSKKLSLGDLNNVKIDRGTLANGDVILYNNVSNLWENGSLLEENATFKSITVQNQSTLNTISASGASTLQETSVTNLTASGASTLQGTNVTTLTASAASTLQGTSVTTLSASGTSTLANLTASDIAVTNTLKIEADKVFVGKNAGATQAANSTIINASGNTLNSSNSGLFIDPIRNIADPSALKSLYYDTTTKEIVEGDTPSGGGGGSSTMDTTDQNTDQDYNLVFADGSGSGKTMFVDSGTTPSTLNPNTGEFRVADSLYIASNGTVSVGKNPNQTTQGNVSISIGDNAGRTNQGTASVALGSLAGRDNQGNGAIAIGAATGNGNQGTNAIGLGYDCATVTQGISSIAIGTRSGRVNQGNYAIAIGDGAGVANQPTNSIIISANGVSDLDATTSGLFIEPIQNQADTTGFKSLYYNTTTKEIVEGDTPSGGGGGSSTIDTTDQNTDQTYNLVFADGAGTGKTMFVDSSTLPSTINPNTGDFSIADTFQIANNGGATHISIGKQSGGKTTPAGDSISIGTAAGKVNAGDRAVALGQSSGFLNMGNYSLAVGNSSGYLNMGVESVACGHICGYDGMGLRSVAIGSESGFQDMGDYSIAIGYRAGQTNQPDNSIILNAQTSALDASTTGFFVAPIQNQADTSGFKSLYYNTTTKEIVEGDLPSGGGGGASTTIDTTESNTNAVYNLVFTDGAGTGKTLLVDSITNPSTINPFSGDVLISNSIKLNSGSVNVGKSAGEFSSSTGCVAIGVTAGQNSQNQGSIAIGYASGTNTQGTNCVSIGKECGFNNQQNQSIAIGSECGYSNLGMNSIVIGFKAGETNMPANSILLNATGQGFNGTTGVSGFYVKPIRSVADVSTFETVYYDTVNGEITTKVFTGSGGGGSTTVDTTNQNGNANYNLVFTNGAGSGKSMFVDNNTTPSTINPSSGEINIVDTLKITDTRVAVGKGSGVSQGISGVSIGLNSGIGQGTGSVSVGSENANSGQGISSTSIGSGAAFANQGNQAVSFGFSSGRTNQELGASSFGAQSAFSGQKQYATACGFGSGYTNQGANSLALGVFAGRSNQAANSIVLNGTGADLNAGSSGLFVAPIANIAGTNGLPALYYNKTTKEVLEGPALSSNSPTFATLDVTGTSTFNNATFSGPIAGTSLDIRPGEVTTKDLTVGSLFEVLGNSYLRGSTTLGGAFLQNAPLIIDNPLSEYVLTINDVGRNIFINNSTNVTNIRLPQSTNIFEGSQVIFSFIVGTLSQPFNILRHGSDGNITGVILTNSDDFAGSVVESTQIDSFKITGISSLNIGDSLAISNFPISGFSKSWYICYGGNSTTVNGFTN